MVAFSIYLCTFMKLSIVNIVCKINTFLLAQVCPWTLYFYFHVCNMFVHLSVCPSITDFLPSSCRRAFKKFTTDSHLRKCLEHVCFRVKKSRLQNLKVCFNLGLPHKYCGYVNTGPILGLHPTNKRRRYKETPSLIGWAKPRISPLARSQ